MAPTAAQPSAVRFSSAIQEIEPRESLAAMTTTSDAVEGAPNRLENLEALEALEPVEEETRQTLRMVSQSLERHRTNNNCTFEPVSLPPSRVRGHVLFSFVSKAVSCVKGLSCLLYGRR